MNPSSTRRPPPRVQLAADFIDPGELPALVRSLEGLIDILEVGTPLLLREGVHLVRWLRETFPTLTLLADAKIVDGGYAEATLAFEAGADLVTVLGVASDETLRAALRAAREHRGEVMVDLLEVRDAARRARQVERLGAQLVCVHTAVDVQHTQGTIAVGGLAALGRVRGVLQRAKLAVAGGLTAEDLAEVLPFAPDVVVVGSAIASAPDPRAEALRVRGALKAFAAVSTPA